MPSPNWYTIYGLCISVKQQHYTCTLPMLYSIPAGTESSGQDSTGPGSPVWLLYIELHPIKGLITHISLVVKTKTRHAESPKLLSSEVSYWYLL